MTQYSLSRSRARIQLGQKLAEGGEGAIYTIPNQADYVAKIYTKQIDGRKQQKLLAMPALVSDRLRKISAWPIDALLDHRNTVCGFVMERISARRDIHELYSPKSRTRAFPEADFRFLVHVCCNIARAFAIVHEHGHVIGDINHGSVLVGPDGIVALIDCDSFQVKSGSDIFTCDVGMPLFTAPEIQGRSLRGLRRIQNHDHFAMAVLLFHLLCMGRHPFAGRYSGAGDMPIEKAITEFRFAYGRNRARLGMERPPGTPPLEAFGTSLAGLFEQAFSANGTAISRPDAKAWVTELGELKKDSASAQRRAGIIIRTNFPIAHGVSSKRKQACACSARESYPRKRPAPLTSAPFGRPLPQSPNPVPTCPCHPSERGLYRRMRTYRTARSNCCAKRFSWLHFSSASPDARRYRAMALLLGWSVSHSAWPSILGCRQLGVAKLNAK